MKDAAGVPTLKGERDPAAAQRLIFAESPPLLPPSAPVWAGVAQRRLPQRLLQEPPAKSKFLAAAIFRASSPRDEYESNHILEGRFFVRTPLGLQGWPEALESP